jgi:epoxide hydrolase-like predicted phosphatase
MMLRAVFVDFGGVLMRTEDQEPRLRLAERLGVPPGRLETLIFESKSSLSASIGEITEAAHWQWVADTLGISCQETEKLAADFFSGDRLDTVLIEFLRSLRPQRRIGLISNAWSGLRDYISRSDFADVFDELVISAEVGLVKPDPRIYHLALDRLAVTPEESLFLDDMPANVQAALSIGMQAVQFTRPEETMAELKRILTDHR